MSKKGLNRRDLLKKLVACSAAPLVGSAVFSEKFNNAQMSPQPDFGNNLDTLGPISENPIVDDVNQESVSSIRVAIFGYFHGGSHTYANIVKQKIADQSEMPLFFSDAIYLPMNADFDKWAQYRITNESKTVRKQLTAFNEAIDKVAQNNANAVFSFRTPFPENKPIILKKLKELNFDFVFVEPENMLKTAATSMLMAEDGLLTTEGTRLWQKSNINWSNGKEVIVPGIVSWFIQRHNDIQNYKKSILNSAVVINQSDETSIAKNLIGDDHEVKIYRDITINGNPIDHIENSDQVLELLKSAKIVS